MLTMPSSKTYQIRIGEKEKQETFAVFNDLGITPAQAVKMFFAQVRRTHGIPFPIEYTPNEKTAKILSQAMKKRITRGLIISKIYFVTLITNAFHKPLERL